MKIPKPEKIYLQFFGDDEPHDEPILLEAITWHNERVFPNDLEYTLSESSPSSVCSIFVVQHYPENWRDFTYHYNRADAEECLANKRAPGQYRIIHRTETVIKSNVKEMPARSEGERGKEDL